MRNKIKNALLLGMVSLSLTGLTSCTKDDIEDLRNQITQLQEELDNIQKQINSLQTKMQNDIEAVKSDYNTKINSLEEKLTTLEVELTSLDEELTKAKKELADKHNEDIETLKTYIDGEISTLKTRIENDENELSSLKTKHDNDVASLQEDYNSKIDNLASQLTTDKKALEDDYNAKLNTLNTTYETKCKTLNDDIASCNTSIEEFKTQYATDKKALEDDYNSKINTLQTTYENKVASIGSSIDTINSNISSLKDEMNSLIEDIQKDYNEKINNLSSRISSLENKKQYNVYYYLDGTLIKEETVSEGDRLSVPTSDLTIGYNISSWYTYDGSIKNSWSFSGCTVGSDLCLYADFTYRTYSVHFVDNKFNQSDKYKSVSYKGYYNFFNIYSKSDYTLTGFKDDDGNSYSLTGNYNLTKGITLYTEWSLNEYTITYNLDDGINPDGNPKNYSVESSTIELLSPSKDGYRFDGWSDGNNIITSIPSGSTGNITLTALWSKYYSLSVTSSDETKGSVKILTTGDMFCYNDTITIKATALDGYKFESWTVDGSVVSNDSEYTFTMVDSDYSLVANFESPKEFSVSSIDESLGSVTIASGSKSSFTNDSITIKATPSTGCEFKGWYTSDEKFVSTSNPYTFSMPSTNYSLIAKFYNQEEVVERKKTLGITPVIDSESNTLTYGLYPQSHVEDTTLIAELNKLTTTESNGWYLYDGNYYAKSYVNHCYEDSDGYYDDGTKIINSTDTWFKCEPISWKILTTSDGTYSLVSNKLLDVHIYNELYTGSKDGLFANNYENSEIREWLNSTFLNSAFNLDSSLIQITTVDNSASTTDSSTNQYVCNNTNDRIYLLSYQDYLNSSYGFSGYIGSTTTRECKTTDYARANGAYYYVTSPYLYNGTYRTRSPNSNSSIGASSLDYNGNLLDFSFTSETSYCIRPAITIKLN